MRSAEHLPMKAYEKDESKKEWCPVHEYRLESSNKKERRFAKKFSTDRTTESWELMKTWRNKATRLRRKAIKDNWNGVSGKLDKNPKKFFGTFMPFIISKCAKDKDSTDISLHIQGQLQQNKQIVEEEFTRYLSTTADNIERMEASCLTEEKCYRHPRVSAIRHRQMPSTFNIRSISKEEVLDALRGINPRKAIQFQFQSHCHSSGWGGGGRLFEFDWKEEGWAWAWALIKFFCR